MYHQVCNRKSDPWELAVSPEIFEEQMNFLKKNFEVVTLKEIASAVKNKSLRNTKIAITFDDGFKDNHTNACPVLHQKQLPASFYMATHAVSSGQPYWWEQLERIILHTEQLPSELKLPVAGWLFHFRFIRDNKLTKKLAEEIRAWSSEKPAGNERTSLFLQLWLLIQPLEFDEQTKLIGGIKEWAGDAVQQCAEHGVMSPADVRSISADPLFTIGAHTVHHAMLAEKDEATQSFEVNQSRKAIEAWVQKPVTGFAFPYGNYNSVTKKILEKNGFDYGVSTECRGVTNYDDVFALPRMQVKNWNEKEFSLKIRQILSA